MSSNLRTCTLCKKRVPVSRSLFKVPKDSERRRRWGEICGTVFKVSSQLCADHFPPSKIIKTGKKSMLMPHADPSLDPENESVDEIRHSGYKRTTDKQYSLLTHEMARFSAESPNGKHADSIMFWNILTEKLNALGPPYRSVQQWKKVWTDFRRFHSKRNFKSKPKFQKYLKSEVEQDKYNDNELFRVDLEEGQQEAASTDNKPSTSKNVANFLRSEWEDYEQNSHSMHSANSNEYADEYTYPDRHSSQQSDPELLETLIPDDTPFDAYSYSSQTGPRQRKPLQRPSVINQASPPPPPTSNTLPPLQPANSRLLDQTLYTLQNQMEHQTKLLEHLSQISSTMAGLMERQVSAVEKQTEALRRQASATEHHTLVMNNFVDMIREKMPKMNSKTMSSSASSNNLPNGNS